MKTRAEQDIEMTARLYDCRSAARGILGASYATTLRPWRDLVGRVMDAKQLSVLQAAIDIGKHIDQSDGLSLMLVMAAGVEMIESPAAPAAVDPIARPPTPLSTRASDSSDSSTSPRAPQEPPA